MSPNTNDTPKAVVPSTAHALAEIGLIANQHAANGAIAEYTSRKAANTLKRQASDLLRFADYLNAIGATINQALGAQMGDFAAAVASHAGDDPDSHAPLDPAVWHGITHGLIKGFRHWMIQNGDAIGSINVRLSTVKTYARLAAESGVISTHEYDLIRLVSGYAHKEARRIDDRRDITRRGDKKAEHVTISLKQAERLKDQPLDTPQGRRDAVLMCLLLDHGLRCGEVALLTVGNFDLQAGTMTFYRPKVDDTQTHELSSDTRRALAAYVGAGDAPTDPAAPLLRGSLKNGTLTSAGMSERAITKRVRALGVDVGLYVLEDHTTDSGKDKVRKVGTLSAHDCRHFWATYWAARVEKLKRGLFTLQEAGGWNSLTMPRRYAETAQIANEGMA